MVEAVKWIEMKLLRHFYVNVNLKCDFREMFSSLEAREQEMFVYCFSTVFKEILNNLDVFGEKISNRIKLCGNSRRVVGLKIEFNKIVKTSREYLEEAVRTKLTEYIELVYDSDEALNPVLTKLVSIKNMLDAKFPSLFKEIFESAEENLVLEFFKFKEDKLNTVLEQETYIFVETTTDYQTKADLLGKEFSLEQLVSIPSTAENTDNIAIDDEDSLKLTGTSLFFIDFCVDIAKIMSIYPEKELISKEFSILTCKLINTMKEDILEGKAIENKKIEYASQKVICAFGATLSLVGWFSVLIGQEVSASRLEYEEEANKAVKIALEKVQELCESSVASGSAALSQVQFTDYPVCKEKGERNEFAVEFYNVAYVYSSAKKCFLLDKLSLVFERVINEIVSQLNRQIILAGVKPEDFDSKQAKQFRRDLGAVKKLVNAVDVYENDRNKETVEKIMNTYVPKKNKEEDY